MRDTNEMEIQLTVNPAMKDLREWQSHHSDADESDGGGSCGCKDGSF